MELKTFFPQDELGNHLPGATCYLYERGTENLVAGLRQANGEGLGNPFKAGADGKAQFAAPNGIYDIRAVYGARDYRISIQLNDVAEDVAAAAAAASRAEVAMDAAQQSAGIYPTVEDGLAATANLEIKYFSVPSGINTESLIIYKNAAGVAQEVKRTPSNTALTEIAQRLKTSPNGSAASIPAIATDLGQVLMWFTNGMLAAAGMAPELRAHATSDVISRINAPNTQMFPLMSTGLGQVLAWMENGRFNAAGLAYTVRDVMQEVIKSINYNPSMFPISYTQTGQVLTWVKDGRFDAAGLSTTINEMIQKAMVASTVKPMSKHSDGSSMYLYRSKIAKIIAGQAAQVRILFQGDSWSDHLKEISQALVTYLYAEYGQAGNGWVSMNADEGGAASTKSQLLNGARLNKSAGNWTLIDMAAGTDSLDGQAAVATGTVATITITGLKTQALKWHYKDDGGTFRYSIDGGAPVVVSGGNTGVRKTIDISGLTDAPHNFVFDLVGNGGTVTFYGGMATRSATGIEFSKAGNGGSTSIQWNGIAAQVQAYSNELKPDLVIFIMGTNDKNQSIGKAAYKAGVQSFVNAHQAGSPGCTVLLMVPILSGSTMDMGLMSSYAEAMYEISQSTGNVEFINLNAFIPPRLVTDALGLWGDGLHINDVGGAAVAGLLMNKFLKVD